MLIKFKCPKCTNSIVKLFKKAVDIPDYLNCGECGSKKMERTLSTPSTKTTQVIDNGVQAKRVEVMSEVVEQCRERALKEDD